MDNIHMYKVKNMIISSDIVNCNLLKQMYDDANLNINDVNDRTLQINNCSSDETCKLWITNDKRMIAFDNKHL